MPGVGSFWDACALSYPCLHVLLACYRDSIPSAGGNLRPPVQHGVVRAGKFPVLTKLSRAPRMGGCVPTWYAALQIMVLRQQQCMHPAHGQQMHASTKTRQHSWSSGKLRPVPEHAYSRVPGKSRSKFDQTLRIQSEHAARSAA